MRLFLSAHLNVADGDAVYDGEEATRAAPVAAAEDGSRQWFGVDLEQLLRRDAVCLLQGSRWF
jgi:hypothetical protein